MHQMTHPIPIIQPPNTLNKVPNTVTPPLVPRGTLAPEVIRMGVPLDSIPNSEANVSAKLVAWCAIREHANADACGELPKSVWKSSE